MIAPLLLLGIPLLSWLSTGALVPAGGTTSLPATTAPGGGLADEDGVVVLHLSGSPYDMGYQHGALLREQVRARVEQELYAGLVGEMRVSHILLLRRAREIEALLPQDYREELKGLADGAGLSYLQVLVLNSAEDLAADQATATGIRELMLSVSPRFTPHFSTIQGADSAAFPEQSSTGERGREVVMGGAFAGFGSATRDGGMVQAAWFASPVPQLNDLVVVVCRPDSGNSYVGLGKPGMVGVLAGLNEEALVATALRSPSQDTALVGIPASILLREVLQHGGGLPAALNILTSAQRTGGHNVLIGDGKRPDAQALEFSAHQFSVFPAENDLVARTQHYLDTELGQTQYSLRWWNGDDSWNDLDSLLRSLEFAYGDLDSETAGKLVEDLTAVEGETGVADQAVRGIVLDGRTLEIRLVIGREGEPTPVVGLDETR